MAVKCLDEIATEVAFVNAFIDTSGATAAASCHDDKQSTTDMFDFPEPEKEPKTIVEESVGKNDSHKETADQCATAPDSSQPASSDTTQQQDASASRDGPNAKKESDSSMTSSQNWVTHFVNSGHDLLWPTGMTPTTGPTLLTGVKVGESVIS